MSQSDPSDEGESQWARSTAWRQGFFLSPETAVELGLVPAEDASGIVAVVSHDCDLAQTADAEPTVEVIVGRRIENIDGNYSHGKNVRLLHVGCSGGASPCNIALPAGQKKLLSKRRDDLLPSLLNHEPSDAWRMTPQERKILQLWLASRYYRSAFPDEFDRRLDAETDVKDRLTRALTPSGQHVSAIFFEVDDGEEVSRNGADDPYELRITLLYSTATDPEAARLAASQVKVRIEEIFSARCEKEVGGVKQWQWIELVGVDVIADTAMSVAGSQSLSKWQVNHISLRASDEQPIVAP